MFYYNDNNVNNIYVTKKILQKIKFKVNIKWYGFRMLNHVDMAEYTKFVIYCKLL